MDIKKTFSLQNTKSREEIRQEQLGKLKEASKMYEQQFLGEMVKAMRSTVHKSEFIPESYGERIFKDNLDQEYVSNWTQRGGVGMADMIYEQLKERYFPERLAKFGPISGPLPVNGGDGHLKIKGAANGEEKKGPIEIEIKPEFKKTTDIKEINDQGLNLMAPWSGKVVFSQAHDDGTKTTILDHGDGLKSELKHTGSLKPIQVGQQVDAGEILGEVRGSDPLVKWNLWT